MAAIKRVSNSVWFEYLTLGQNPAICLFCFPYAGGSAQVFRPWRQYIPPDVEICLVHLPGRAKRFGEPPFTRLSLLVDALASHIHDELRQPFAFYGHSMGAVISFELARELRRRYGIEPAHLFLSGSRAPHLIRSKPLTFNLPDDEFIAELRRLNGTPRELLENPQTTELFLPVLRADFETMETYEYRTESRLSCPIAVYGGLQDEDVPVDDLRAWKEQTPAALKVGLFRGDHFFIHSSSMEFLKAFKSDVESSLASPGGTLPLIVGA